jgi:hypothetical protein
LTRCYVVIRFDAEHWTPDLTHSDAGPSTQEARWSTSSARFIGDVKEIPLCPCETYVKQPLLLLDVLQTSRMISWDSTFMQIDHCNGLIFAPFGVVKRRKLQSRVGARIYSQI